ncbi:hypothetical protein Pla163_10890 [Planctomycetes bacterium Pla163]|uniref:Uncharacterized protein n=1 Tax=Rohdeia mirabilis TaxID=2528008 RepID=A0A518CXP9_9BACT|nr:hypothetical protein Pla163_10890 [Planctomycetes bacterium Pla163]
MRRLHLVAAAAFVGLILLAVFWFDPWSSFTRVEVDQQGADVSQTGRLIDLAEGETSDHRDSAGGPTRLLIQLDDHLASLLHHLSVVVVADSEAPQSDGAAAAEAGVGVEFSEELRLAEVSGSGDNRIELPLDVPLDRVSRVELRVPGWPSGDAGTGYVLASQMFVDAEGTAPEQGGPGADRPSVRFGLDDAHLWAIADGVDKSSALSAEHDTRVVVTGFASGLRYAERQACAEAVFASPLLVTDMGVFVAAPSVDVREALDEYATECQLQVLSQGFALYSTVLERGELNQALEFAPLGSYVLAQLDRPEPSFGGFTLHLVDSEGRVQESVEVLDKRRVKAPEPRIWTMGPHRSGDYELYLEPGSRSQTRSVRDEITASQFSVKLGDVRVEDSEVHAPPCLNPIVLRDHFGIANVVAPVDEWVLIQDLGLFGAQGGQSSRLASELNRATMEATAWGHELVSGFVSPRSVLEAVQDGVDAGSVRTIEVTVRTESVRTTARTSRTDFIDLDVVAGATVTLEGGGGLARAMPYKLPAQGVAALTRDEYLLLVVDAPLGSALGVGFPQADRATFLSPIEGWTSMRVYLVRDEGFEGAIAAKVLDAEPGSECIRDGVLVMEDDVVLSARAVLDRL